MNSPVREFSAVKVVSGPLELAQLGIASSFMIGFGRTGSPVLDGVKATASIVGVQRSDCQHWMTGLRWNLVSLNSGDWALLNQGNRSSALTAKNGTVVLDDLNAWALQGQRWTMFHDFRLGLFQFRNRAGGWLSLQDLEPRLVRRTVECDISSVSWRLEEPFILPG